MRKHAWETSCLVVVPFMVDKHRQSVGRRNAVCDKSDMAHCMEDLALRTSLQAFIPLRQNDIANYRAPGAFRKGLLSRSISTLVRSNSSKITDGAMTDEGGVRPVELI